MKLLHDFFRWPFAGVRSATSRSTALPHDFSVTVPVPLGTPANDAPKPPETARSERREPASFLRSPRRRRLGRTHRWSTLAQVAIGRLAHGNRSPSPAPRLTLHASSPVHALSGRSRWASPSRRDVAVASTVAHAFRDTAALLDALHSHPGGLDAEQIRARLQRDGLNEASREKPPHWSLQLLRAFRNPFIVVLLVLAGVQLVHPPLRPLALTLFRALATIP